MGDDNGVCKHENNTRQYEIEYGNMKVDETMLDTLETMNQSVQLTSTIRTKLKFYSGDPYADPTTQTRKPLCDRGLPVSRSSTDGVAHNFPELFIALQTTSVKFRTCFFVKGDYC